MDGLCMDGHVKNVAEWQETIFGGKAQVVPGFCFSL